MPAAKPRSGFARIDNAQLYYELAGDGQPFVMIHAGVADHRQWNNEFDVFAKTFRVLRYDLRGYGRSEPVQGEFSNLGDLVALLDHLDLREPLVMMGCSMGGGLAMDFALAHPSRVRALIMVDSGPSGLKLDVPTPAKLDEAEQACSVGDLDRVAELETQVWFDGTGRDATQVDQTMRRLLYEMNRNALALDAKGLGKRVPDSNLPAAGRLGELGVPVLVIVGAHDTPFILAAADYMEERLSPARKVVIQDAAHLPNMDHPEEFQGIVKSFLNGLPG